MSEILRVRFAELFGTRRSPHVSLAPGRVNLIGEHTDYNGGFVLPMAINRGVAVAFAPRDDTTIRAFSLVFNEIRVADIVTLQPTGEAKWFDFIAAVVWAMREEGVEIGGVDMVVDGNVPVGAGLASSAALEMAVARAMCSAFGVVWEPVRMASLCQRAENRYVGVNCGIMDQFAASVCETGTALLLDCRTLEYSLVPIPAAARIVVMDTGVRRTLATSEYNDRRRSCELAAITIGRTNPAVRSLRDVDWQTLAAARNCLGQKVFNRASHVVREIQRPAHMADAFRERNLALAGNLMDESHASLRDLYEVSCPELDLITSIAREHDACFGARMTGAGFGGCAVALVSSAGAERFVAEISKAYSKVGEVRGAMYVCSPSAGASIIKD